MRITKAISSWLGLVLLVALALTTHASAQNDSPPAIGTTIFSLTGQTIPADNVITDYSTSFVATTTLTTVTFVFRHDPGYFAMDNVSVANTLTPSFNEIVNGTFTAGAPDSAGEGAPGWTYFEQDGIPPQYQGYEGGNGWYDGCVGGYDGIDQTIATVVGNTYNVTFTLSQTGGSMEGSVYQPTSTNGQTGSLGNGIDMLVYVGAGAPSTTVPEPSTWTLLLGLAAAFFAYGRRLAVARN